MDMQKVIGFILIFTGCTGLGLWYGWQFTLQLRALQEFCRILELFLGEIRFGRSTLPQCCLKLAERTEEPYKQGFQMIYERIQENSGESFEEICTSCLEQGLKGVRAHTHDKELFIQCFSKSGFEEDTLQLRSIEQTKEELEDRMSALSKENASKCRLALSLGTMSGLLIIILFL